MWFVAHTANGPNPTTHSFAVVYEKAEDFEAIFEISRIQMNSIVFKALSAAAEPVDEVVYSHVKGYGGIRSMPPHIRLA